MNRLPNNFEFVFRGNIFFGVSSRYYLLSILQENNFKNPCVVIDEGLLGLHIIEELVEKISNVTIVKCDISEPTYTILEEKRNAIMDIDIDVFIGIGGGSAMDMAKGLSVIYTNKGAALSYRGFNLFKEPIMPIIAVPTTAGTGSEITPNASFIDTLDKKKMGINGEGIRPKFAILDPELTISCPKSPTISAGLDSLVHATEAYVAKKSNPLAKMFAKKGFELVFENLPLLVEDLNDIKLRYDVMYGAFLSAIALMNSGTGPAAAMSYPLGVHYGVPHGIGGAIFLPHVVKLNIDSGYNGYFDLVDYNHADFQKNEKLDQDFLSKMKEIWDVLGVPKDIKTFGVTLDNLDQFLSDTLELTGALEQNPIPFGREQIEAVLMNLNIENSK